MPDGVDTCIEMIGVERRFAEGDRVHVVLAGVDLRVGAGEAIAIRGRSGSGKSTLLNLLAAIDAPNAGTISIGGTRITGLRERERTLFRRANIGFVYQSFNLVPTLNAADNIRLVLELNGVAAASARRRVREVLGHVGLDDRAASYPDTLSGGEQQRIAVARAIAHRPRLLVADEPTGNLDDDNAEQVADLLQQLSSEQGSTLVLATHSQRLAERCDRVVELRNGRLDGPGPA